MFRRYNYLRCVNASYIKKKQVFMLRQRSSEVMDRTCTRPPYALHGVFQTIGYPPNWLFSRAHANVASGQTVGENCIVNMANRLTDDECKETAKSEMRRVYIQ